ncbi:hypothetical protein RFI_29851, partial [Reticulomyxa filosa]
MQRPEEFLAKSSIEEFQTYVEKLEDIECTRLHLALNDLIKKKSNNELPRMLFFSTFTFFLWSPLLHSSLLPEILGLIEPFFFFVPRRRRRLRERQEKEALSKKKKKKKRVHRMNAHTHTIASPLLKKMSKKKKKGKYDKSPKKKKKQKKTTKSKSKKKHKKVNPSNGEPSIAAQDADANAHEKNIWDDISSLSSLHLSDSDNGGISIVTTIIIIIVMI